MPLTIGPQLQQFFAQPLLATVCTLNSRGAPEMTPIWYEYFDGFIWFNGTATREWLKRMQSTRRATFFLLDRANNWKWVQVWGRVVEVSDDVGTMAFKRLGRRYGRSIGHVDGRRYIKLEITSVKGRAGSPTEMWTSTPETGVVRRALSVRERSRIMRQPTQVLVYLARRSDNAWQYLMLHRVARGDDFWQGVTGGVEDDESPLDAAYREVSEETGFTPDRMVDLDYSYTFPLADKWRDLYAVGVEEIREYAFVATVLAGAEPRPDPREHDAWQWCGLGEALVLLRFPGNRTALRQADAWLHQQPA